MNKLMFLILGLGISIHAAESAAFLKSFKEMAIAPLQSAEIPSDWPQYEPTLTVEQKFELSKKILSRWPQLSRCALNPAEYCSALSRDYKKDAFLAGYPAAIVHVINDLRVNIVGFGQEPGLTCKDLDGIEFFAKTHVNDHAMLTKCERDLNAVRAKLNL